MKRPRHRAVRLSSALLLAALLLVPLIERGHSHTSRDLARPCAACVAAHHSPAATAPVVAVAAPVAQALIAVFASEGAPLRRAHSPQSGRAPPLPSHIVSV